LEIVKKRLYNNIGIKTESAKYTLHKLLISILKLYAPIVPHISEEIYNDFESKSIHLSDFPNIEKYENKIEKLGDEALEIIAKARKFKADNKKSLKEHIKLTLNDNKLEMFKEDLEAVCNADVFFDKEFKIELK
jgi:valyl-tRNA synthetase